MEFKFKFDVGQLVQFKTRPGVSFCVGLRCASFSSDESGAVPRVPNYHVSRVWENGERECWPNVLEWELEPFEKPAACCLVHAVASVIDLRGKGDAAAGRKEDDAAAVAKKAVWEARGHLAAAQMFEEASQLRDLEDKWFPKATDAKPAVPSPPEGAKT